MATRALALVIALAAAACSSSVTKSGKTTEESVHRATAAERAADAYVWGYPLVVTERTLQSLALRAPVNRLTFQPARSGMTSRTIVAPNTDTLYAVAPLDLRAGPYLLTLPAIHDRYYSFQLISAYTDSFAYIGTRATRGRAGTWAVTPPGWHGQLPPSVTRVASPTPQLLVLGRFLVADDADVDRVHALGRRLKLEPLTPPPAPQPPPMGTPAGTPQTVAEAGLGFFDELGDALAINPPVDAVERRTMNTFATLGIGPGRHPSVQLRDRALRNALTEGVRLGQRRITAAESGTAKKEKVNGWAVNLHVGTYGHDSLLRAVVAHSGWGANVAAEAVYAQSSGHDGNRRYVLHFPPGALPPVDAFWSVTMYGPDRFFVANPVNRYAIGDRTAGLRYDNDGSLDIYIQHESPAGHDSNWLPAPAGPFLLVMRLYLPKPAVLEGRYRYPRLADVGGAA